MPFQIRPAEPSDVPQVHAIEQRVFADPWSTQDFRDCVSYALFLVAEADGKVVGYAVALEAADEGEILNLAVAEGGRRRGLGRALVEAIVDASLTLSSARLLAPHLTIDNCLATVVAPPSAYGTTW